MIIACLGHTLTHIPQPMQVSAFIEGRDLTSRSMARQVQENLQLMHSTPCHARQLRLSTNAKPILIGVCVTSSSSMGQASTQA
jgi:hypothetical protein